MWWREEGEGVLKGTAQGETLTGTERLDLIRVGGGDDVVRGLGGPDALHGEGGKDRLYGGPGDDILNAQDGSRGGDEIFCGPGDDEALMDGDDRQNTHGCESFGIGMP